MVSKVFVFVFWIVTQNSKPQNVSGLFFWIVSQIPPLWRVYSQVCDSVSASRRIRQTATMRNQQTYTLTARNSAENQLGLAHSALGQSPVLNFKCGICGETLDATWETDHIIPLSAARSAADFEKLNSLANLQPVHRIPCHQLKSSREAAGR